MDEQTFEKTFIFTVKISQGGFTTINNNDVLHVIYKMPKTYPEQH
jgi:hypothetical protein